MTESLCASLQNRKLFTANPQVRPLSFNEQTQNDDLHGESKKEQMEKKHSLTQGALTFCCSCSHLFILVFRVLEQNKGPKGAITAITPRLPTLPRFIVYDFGCGIFSTTYHALWQAREDTTIVSDKFHAVNHTYSPFYVPTLCFTGNEIVASKRYQEH